MTNERLKKIVGAMKRRTNCPQFAKLPMPNRCPHLHETLDSDDCQVCWAEAIGRELDGEANA